MSQTIALIFDVDGVIIDSTSFHTEAWRSYLQQNGIEIAGIDRRMLGKHNDEIVRDFFRDCDLTGDEVFRHGARKEALYRKLIEPEFETVLVPGVSQFIRKYRYLPMGVASNAEAANVDFVLERAGIRDCFRAVVNGHDVKRPKPNPDIYLRAAELLGIKPGMCVVFEDSDTGVTAARAAGMGVIGVLTTLPGFDNVELAISDFLDPALDRWMESELAGKRVTLA